MAKELSQEIVVMIADIAFTPLLLPPISGGHLYRVRRQLVVRLVRVVIKLLMMNGA